MPPKKLKLTAISDSVRVGYSKMVRQSLEMFAEPCHECEKDLDPGEGDFVAKPDVSWQWSLVAYLTERGEMDTTTVYIVHSSQLHSDKQRTMNFTFGKDRVSVKLLFS